VSRFETILNKIKIAVYSIAPNAEIYLYGSRAKNTATSYSDWDILILLNAPTISFEFEKQLISVLYDVEIETGEVISPVIYTKKDWNERLFITPLFENINHDGIRL
jgi:predicted nucleotidyltransferase